MHHLSSKYCQSPMIYSTCFRKRKTVTSILFSQPCLLQIYTKAIQGVFLVLISTCIHLFKATNNTFKYWEKCEWKLLFFAVIFRHKCVGDLFFSWLCSSCWRLTPWRRSWGMWAGKNLMYFFVWSPEWKKHPGHISQKNHLSQTSRIIFSFYYPASPLLLFFLLSIEYLDCWNLISLFQSNFNANF